MYLAIDTSSVSSGLALIQNSYITAELTWQCQRNHTVELLPHLDDILKRNNLNITKIRGIIVACGPGSFNGLRVGLSSAKGLAYSLSIPIIGISTLESAAYQHAVSDFPICAILPAGREEYAYAIYNRQKEWNCLVPEHLSTIIELCKHITEPHLFSGEINLEIEAALRHQLGEKAVFCKATSSRVAALASLGEKRLAAGITDNVSSIQPLYLRRPHISQPKKNTGVLNNCRNMAVIWDVDGTIADTAELHFQAWHDVFAKHCLDFSREDFRRDFGMRNDVIIQNFLGDNTSEKDIQVISNQKNSLFREALQQHGLNPMSGACELLNALHKHGIPMAVASSAPRQNTEIILRILGISHLFQIIVSGDEVTHSKPNPEIFQKAAAKLGFKVHQCVVIEDAVCGIAGACAAGMHSIGVAANHPSTSLQKADMVVDTLSQVTVLDVEKLSSN